MKQQDHRRIADKIADLLGPADEGTNRDCNRSAVDWIASKYRFPAVRGDFMDSDSVVSRMFGHRIEDFRRTREHLCFFDRQTIRTSPERAGFEVLRIDSYGLTIRMDSLARRTRPALPRTGEVPERMVRWSGLSRQQLHFDPRIKMVVYARRGGTS